MPRQSVDPQFRSSTPPSGNEYDTRLGQPRLDSMAPPTQPAPNYAGNNYQYPSGQPGYQEGTYDDRFASRQWQNQPATAQQGGAVPTGYHPWQQQPQSYPQPAGNLLVRGHDMPLIPNQARMASRPGYQEDYASHDITANIPGNGQQQPEVGPNRNPNPELPAAQINRFNSFLYFLLLCSIGLNIYLAWISRGFYVRYRELADELRETFATTV